MDASCGGGAFSDREKSRLEAKGDGTLSVCFRKSPWSNPGLNQDKIKIKTRAKPGPSQIQTRTK